MGKVRILVVLAIALNMSIQATIARSDIVETFAICTGRLSAELEHSWLVGYPPSDPIAAQRADFIELLVTVTPPDRRREALGARVDAKMAHSVLLTRAAFARDAKEEKWALAQAKMQLKACTDLLLSS